MNRMPHYIWISFKTNDYYKLVSRLYKSSISYYDLKITDHYIYIKILRNDYNKVKKYLISYKIKKVSDSGIYKIINIIKKNYIILIGFFISFLYLFILNNMIIKIEIINNDKEIVSRISESLSKYKLRVLTLKKDHLEIEGIVDKILNDNKEYIEWLEIKYDGIKMIVEVTEKVKEEIIKDDGVCNIVSKSDAKIISYKLKKGDPLFKLNQYVYKDEVLVTGIIKHNEEIKDTLCASAIIYGELWYKVSIEVPFNSEEYVETGRHQFNIKIVNGNKDYKILRSKYKKYNETRETLYKLNDFKIELVREKEKKLKTIKLTEKEAYEKGIKMTIDKINMRLDKDEAILEKKVLKNVVNDSTMVIDIFVVTKEKINKTVSAEVELDDINGTNKSN